MDFILFDKFDTRFEELASKLVSKLEGWVEDVVLSIPNFLIALIVIILFIILAKVAGNVSQKLLTRVSSSSVINRLLKNFIIYLLLALGIFTSLEVLNLGKAVTSLLAGAGIIGLALSFAFQDIAANFVSGILIAIRQPFREGDLIETHDYMGHVSKINLRSTSITTFQGQNVMIPNRKVFENPVTIYTTGYRRIDLKVGISYGEDLDFIERVTIEAIQSLEFLAEEKDVKLYFQQFGDSSINFIVVYWIRYPDVNYFMAKSEGIKRIKAAYNQHDIVIPFPIRTLDFGVKGGKSLDAVVADNVPFSVS